MNILITGGAGFMGSNMVRFLLATHPDAQITNFDKLTYAGNLENLADVAHDPRYRFVQGDIADPAAVNDLCAKESFDVVLNYAAETHVDRSIKESRSFLVTDVLGTHTLLEAVKRFRIPRMIQISTDEVYGSIEHGAFSEESPFRPNSPYSASKAGGDHLCRAYVVTHHVPVIVTHSCNVYGPYQYPEKFIPRFTTNLLDGLPGPVYANGRPVREWIYVEDHCRAVDTILRSGKVGDVYNIGSSDQKQNIDVIKAILRLLDKDESWIQHVPDRPGHDMRYAVDSTKLRTQTGWKPLMAFEQGLRQTVQWYQEHREWWEPLKARLAKEEHL